MDPLGALAATVDIDTLPTWNTTQVPFYNIMVDDPNNMRKSTFKWREDLNRKIILWYGDMTCLNAEAFVNSTNESMTDRNPLSERIFYKAGIELRHEIRTSVKVCRTGDAKLTKGYKLPARYVIHTVGPRYNIKYKTAAESALYNSYRNVLQIVRENKIRTLAIPCVHSMKRGYPSSEGAHIAIRTVRRYLEKYGDDIDSLVFSVIGQDKVVYLSLLPLYFPRSKNEEDFVAYHLPYDVGNENGEPVIAERQIRIFSNPILLRGDEVPDMDESATISEVFETSVSVGSHAFSKMQTDPDRRRKLKGPSKVMKNMTQTTAEDQQKRYDRWLKRAKKEDLSTFEETRCLYQSGFDKHNRPVVVFVGKNFINENLNVEKATMFVIKTLDRVVSQKFVFVYLHTLTQKVNQPEKQFIKDIYNLVDKRYKQNLQAFYVVHSTFWSKVVTWFFTTFAMADMKDKLHHIPGLEYLYSRIPPDQLDLPQFVIDHDMQVNGARYYDPEEDQAIGSL